MRFNQLGFIAAILVSVGVLSAQEKSVTAEAFFTGTAQPVAIDLPLPIYSKAATEIGLSGRVSVAITVDEAGNISTVEDADGPYPICKTVTDPKVLDLRRAALAAAKLAKFKPAVVDGKPVWASGRINFTFPTTGERKMGGLAVGAVDDKATSGARVIDPDGKASEDGSSKGVLNGKATELPRPVYPAAAKAVRATGSVSVQAVIAEDGGMYSAEAVSGHPLLRRSSEIAACGSRFLPTLLSGQPVKVAGIITYNYVP